MLKERNELRQKKPSDFTTEERKKIIEEYLLGDATKNEIWYKYTGRVEEHGKLLNWMRALGYNVKKKVAKLEVSKPVFMSKSITENSLENVQLKEKVKQLEQALVQSELRAISLETIIEVAEKELKINIKKKSYTKQSIK